MGADLVVIVRPSIADATFEIIVREFGTLRQRLTRKEART